jgi:hypothetical protein
MFFPRAAAWEADLAALLPEIENTAAGAEAVFLRHSIAGVLRELGPGGPWERAPFFYLKVATLAWAPILAGTPRLEPRDEEKLTELLAQAAQVFAAGAQQINALTLPTRLLSATVFTDVCRFFDEELPSFLAAQGLPGKS